MTKEPMSFKAWLLKRHIGKDTRVGDLARDVREDSGFPDTDDFAEMRDHIEYARGGCHEAVIALMDAYVKWDDYKTIEYEKQKREAEERSVKKHLEQVFGR